MKKLFFLKIFFLLVLRMVLVAPKGFFLFLYYYFYTKIENLLDFFHFYLSYRQEKTYMYDNEKRN